MARIFIDGFESGGYDLCDGAAGAVVVASASYGMDGSYCLDLTSTADRWYKNVSDANEYYCAVLWRPNSGFASGIVSFWNGTNMLCGVRTNGSNRLLACRYLTGVATGTIDVSTGSTYLIEIYANIHDTSGRIQVKVNGVTDIDFTGDTKPGADTIINSIRLGYNGSHTEWWCRARFDNFVVDNSEFPGESKIRAIVPSGAGASILWTPSAGSNYACVDEVPVSDADYVSVDAVDQIDTYAMSDLPGNASTIKCVQAQARMNKDGTPTPQNVNLAVRSGGANYFSADKAVPSAYASLCHIWTTNPADSAAWEKADVDAIEAGVRSRI